MTFRKSEFTVFISAFVAFSPAWDGNFVFDDLPAIVDNPEVTSINRTYLSIFTKDFWGTSINDDESHKSYRPLTTLAFKLLHYIFQSETSPSIYFHLTNILLHCWNSVLFYKFSKKILKFRDISTLSGLIFAVHPVHAESVAGIVGLADLLYSHFFLRAVTRYFKAQKSYKNILLVIAYGFISMLCKEQGIMTLPTIIAFSILNKIYKFHRKTARNYSNFQLMLLTSATLSMLLLRLWISDFKSPVFETGDNPHAFIEDFFLRIWNRLFIYSINVILILTPAWLCCDWSMGALPIIKEYFDPLSICPLMLLLSLAFFLPKCFGVKESKKKSRLLISTSIFTIFPFLPSSNIFVTVGFTVAERNLYLTVGGLCILVSYGCFKMSSCLTSKVLKALIKLSIFHLIFIFCIKSRLRSEQWRTERDLFTSALLVCPNNAKIHYNLGKIESRENDDERALHYYENSIKLAPDFVQALNNLGNVYRKFNDIKKSEDLLRRAVELKPKFPAARMNLGITLAKRGLNTEAELQYKKAIELRKGVYPDCLFNLGNLYLKQNGRESEAELALKAAIEQNPNHKSAWSNLIMLLINLNQNDKALKLCTNAVIRFPEIPDFYFHLANIYGEKNKFEEAEQNFLKAIEKRPFSSLYHSNLGVLYQRFGKLEKAMQAYSKAIKLDKKNVNANTNLEKVKVMMAKSNQM